MNRIVLLLLLTAWTTACSFGDLPYPIQANDAGRGGVDARGTGSVDGASDAQADVASGPAALLYVSNTILDTSTLSERNNGNGRAEPGETLRMAITLRNSGASTARGVSATLSTTSACATVRTTSGSPLSYGDLTAGESAINEVSYERFEIVLSTTCPVGTPIALAAQVTDAAGHTWMLPFTLPVAASDAAIVYASNTILDTSTLSERNNGNGRAEPGETLRMAVTLRNSGASTARGVRATLSTTSACATVRTTSGSPLFYGDLTAGESAINEVSYERFEIVLSTTCPVGTPIALAAQVTDAAGHTWMLPFTLPVAASDAAVVYASNAFSDATSVSGLNNGNGRAEPGETLRMAVTLRNSGASTARGVTATLSTPSACATVRTTSGSPLSYGDLTAGESAINEVSYERFEIVLSTTCVAGTSIALSLRATDASGNSWNLPFVLGVQ